MATQMQMIQALIDKIEKQAKHSALLEQQIEGERQLAVHWMNEASRVGVELEEALANNNDEYNAAVIHTNMLVREKHDLQERVSRLESELEDARLILEPLSLAAQDDFVDTYRGMAIDFVQKWGMQPADPYAGLVEYKEAVSVNGR